MAGLVTDGQPNRQHWQGREVLVTGHTGFKGGWLVHLLSSLGSRVHGLALAPPTNPSLFEVGGVQAVLASDFRVDVRSVDGVAEIVEMLKPQTVFHLAAQPLVLRSSDVPIETITTNIDGTASVLEGVRGNSSETQVIIVTTDKVYIPSGDYTPRTESDPLGGYDIYSASKSCAELVTAAYRDSLLDSSLVQVATARAGNVIGGGDWSGDRLFPDLFRAILESRPLVLRHPEATRPWQHVLDALRGYLLLAEALASSAYLLPTSFNFGPLPSEVATVTDVLSEVAEQTSDMPPVVVSDKSAAHETLRLSLDSSSAFDWLGWRPWWDLRKIISVTLDWDAAWRSGEDMHAFTRKQVSDYLAKDQG